MTSNPTPPSLPARKASRRAVSSTTGPRLVLMRIASGFSAARNSRSTMPRVAGPSGQCKVTTSARGSASASGVRPRLVEPGTAAAMTFMPKALAILATAWPMAPSPSTTSVWPESSRSGVRKKQKSGPAAQRPALTAPSCSPTRKAKCRIMAKTISATDSVEYAGTLVTAIPRARAASRATTLVPVEVRPM